MGVISFLGHAGLEVGWKWRCLRDLKELLVDCFEGVDALFKVEVVGGQLGFVVFLAEALFEHLLGARCEGGPCCAVGEERKKISLVLMIGGEQIGTYEMFLPKAPSLSIVRLTITGLWLLAIQC